MSHLLKLAETLDVGEAGLLGRELSAGKPISMAMNAVNQERRQSVRDIIEQILKTADPVSVGEILLAMSAMGKNASTKMELVWSGPMPNGAMGRRTWAVAEDLISRAKEFIYAATYSAGENSPYVQELKTAVKRGIKVVCLVDPHNLPKPANEIRKQLPGAKLLAFAGKDGTDYPYMHSKFLVVDGSHAFLTSANFSVAAADSNLETGIWIRNSFVAQQIKEHVDQLCEAGILTLWNEK